MRTLVVLGLAAALLMPVTLAAFDPGSVPLLLSGGGPGTGWASFKVSTDGAPLVVKVDVHRLSGPVQMGSFVFDWNDQLVFASVATVAFGVEGGQYVDLHPAPGVDVHHDARVEPDHGGNASTGLFINVPGLGTPQPGQFKILVYAAGVVDSWSYEVRGGPGVALGSNLEGASTFLLTNRDFSGVANVAAEEGGVGGQAIVAASAGVQVERHLFGSFGGWNFKTACAVACVNAPSTSVRGADTPDGQKDCTTRWCAWYDAAPGRYAFSASQADASTLTPVYACEPAPVVHEACAALVALPDDAIASGADADLPS